MPKTPDITLPRLTSSALSSLHRDTGPLGAALRDLPGWAEAAAALVHLDKIRPARHNYASLDVEMDELVADAVTRQAPLDVDEALAHAGKVSDRLNGRQTLDAAFARQTQHWTSALDDTARAHRADLYAALDKHFDDLVSLARKLSDVISLSPADAIERGVEDRWRDSQVLLNEADKLRTSRSRLTELGGWDDAGALLNVPELRWMRNPTKVFKHWRAWRVDGCLVNPRDITDRKPLTAPWPDFRYGRSVSDEGRAWLEYLAHDTTAEPWIPSPEQYIRAATQLAAYLSTMRPSSARVYETTEPAQPEYVEHSKDRVSV